MIVRQARPRDMIHIRRLIGLYPKQLMQSRLPKSRDFFVAVDGGAVIGCCALEIYSRKIGELRSLAVHPRHIGKGIASRLVERCLQRAKKKGVHQILAISGAERFFRRFGFSTFQQEKYALLKIIR